MDFLSSLEQLETATRILLASPQEVTKERRNEAESIIMTFRRTRNAFVLCKFILENRCSELVIFETADVLRLNLIQDWSKIAAEDVTNICSHILNLLLSNTDLSFSVQRRLAGVIALIVKHQSLINDGKQRSDLVDRIVQSAVNSTGHPLVVACCILDALLSEHQYVVNAEDASLNYEMHFVAKKNFENSELLKMFQFCLRFLTNYNHVPGKDRDLDHVLKVIENILCWNFTKANLPKRVAGVIEMEATPTFKPPGSWRDTINDEGFVPAFFNIHVKVRHDDAFILRTINLLAQLVSMQRPIPMVSSVRAEFLARILPPFTTLLNLPNKHPTETYGLSDVIRKIMLFNRVAILSSVQPSILLDFFKAIGRFSCEVIQQSALEESKSSVDDRVYRDSLTRVLEAWMNILTDPENMTKEVVHPIVTDIFNSYLKAHLSPPEGFRVPPLVREEVIDEDDQEPDTNQFRDQLQAVGVFGRFILPHAIPIITQLISYKCSAFQKQIELIAGNAAPRESLEPLYEDLHWGILIAGHILAFDALGETALIPKEINEYSISVGGSYQNSAIAFQNAFMMDSSSALENVDPIVRLVCSVILLSETERRVHASGLGELLSPEVASNILWFLHRFVESYFLITEEYYVSPSECFTFTWGPTSEIAKTAQTALLRKVKEDLIRYSAEAEVMKGAIDLLSALVDSKQKAKEAIQSPELPPIVQLTNEVGPAKCKMPNETYRKLVKAVLSIGSLCEEEGSREQYWDQVLIPLSARFQNLTSIRGKDRHRDDVRLEMACVLSGFIGASSSSRSRTAPTLYKRIGPVVAECGAILDTYHNYVDIVELCLELIIELARQALSYLSPADSLTLYRAAMSVVKSYALHAVGRVSAEKTAEEDSYNDLVKLMDMLTCLLAKDFLDLSPESLSEGGEGAGHTISACDVSLHGLRVVLPLMNADLLRFPNLSSKYFRLVSFLSELHAEKMMQLDGAMLQTVYQSVLIGLQNSTAEHFGICCEFISCMAFHIARQSLQSVPSSEFCKPFLKLFLEMILSQPVGKDNIMSMSTVLFALISAFPEAYSELVHQLLGSRNSEEARSTLSNSFEKLTIHLNMQKGGDRVSRTAFRDRLELFIFEAKGCLD